MIDFSSFITGHFGILLLAKLVGSNWKLHVCKWQSLQLFDLLRPSGKFCSTYLKIVLLLNVHPCRYFNFNIWYIHSIKSFQTGKSLLVFLSGKLEQNVWRISRQGVNLNLKLFLLLTTKLLHKVGVYHQNSYLNLSVSLSFTKNF